MTQLTTTDFSVTVDEGICMGAGYCYGSLPQVFLQNPDGTSRSNNTVSSEWLDNVEKASQVCPSGAITIHHRKDTA
ncbi:ferredoxin [Mycolicibacterium sp.]|uniref:ferredoxin n=1 Tax=Mycolicibacterium sp. TaxID=2320850 RepID=UPI0009265311|nr:ferredoxin [Mycolicibacterium sp.]SHV53010.1 Protein of uncharacterised function (DUF1271) [Mycobacteroides abscessus subsp. abscessus]